MPNLSNAEAALLGLLSEGPMHPYQLEKEVRTRDMRFWTELSMSSIYKRLRKLEKEGLVARADQVSAENRLRKLYTISRAGRTALAAALRRLLSDPEHVRWRVDIGAYNSALLPDGEVRRAMAAYRRALQERVKGYRDLRKFLQDSDCPPRRLTIADRPLFLLKGEIEWVDAFLAAMGAEGGGGTAPRLRKEKQP